MIYATPVILCGGSGTRLWPLSRSGFPKQFLSLTGTETLFQQAVQRIAGLADHNITVNKPLIVPNEEHRFHRLAYPGNTPPEIIEAQSGSYLGEDDIIRIVDIYGRS